MGQEKLYPIYFDGKYWEEEDCYDVFVGFYHTRLALNEDMGVYVSDDTWVYPDGSFEEW